jgi:hypothetical protein
VFTSIGIGINCVCVFIILSLLSQLREKCDLSQASDNDTKIKKDRQTESQVKTTFPDLFPVPSAYTY